MLNKGDVIPLLLEACPSFQQNWNEYLGGEKEPAELYLSLGWFAEHIVDLYKQNKTDEFTAIFNVVERLHIKGDDYVREAATIGLLEDIQNRLQNENDFNTFIKFLGPVSRDYWEKLIDFWNKVEN